MEELEIPEGNLQARFDLPVRLKIGFENACRLEKVTMRDKVIELIQNYLNYSV